MFVSFVCIIFQSNGTFFYTCIVEYLDKYSLTIDNAISGLFLWRKLWQSCLNFFFFLQGLVQHHEEIVEYFKTKGVSAIFLFRRNLLRRMISILANSYDQNAKPLNGTHKSHVHSPHEVFHSPSLSLFLFPISLSYLSFPTE